MLERGDVQLIGVREPWEYEEGHIPGCRLLPMGEVSIRLREIDPDAPAISTSSNGHSSPDLTQAGERSKTARPLVASSRGRELFRRHFTSAVSTVCVRNPSLTGVVATHGRAGGLVDPDHEGGAAIMSPILPELVESRRTAFPRGSALPANSAATPREPRGKVAIPIVPP